MDGGYYTNFETTFKYPWYLKADLFIYLQFRDQLNKEI